MRLYQQGGYDMVGGFYDVDHWYQFKCESTSDKPDWTRIELMAQDTNGEYRVLVTQSDTDLLVIEPHTMQMARSYLLFCVGMLDDKYEGVVSQLLSTEQFEEDFAFNIYSNDASTELVTPYSQVITLEVAKYMAHQNRTLLCGMGFISSVGKLPISERTAFGHILSSATQLVNTVLPSDPYGSVGGIELYAECYDSSGRKRMKFFPVGLAEDEGKYQDYSLQSEHPRISDIIIYAMRYPEASEGTIRKFLGALDSAEHRYNWDEVTHVVYHLHNYFSKDPSLMSGLGDRVLPILE